MASMCNIDLSTVEGIQLAYEKLDQQEELINKELESYVSRQYHLESKLKNITKAIPKLQEVGLDAEKLAKMVQHTATLAENVSEKVRRLDTTRSRVSECQQRVHDLLDLQLCSEGVQAALRNEDYEKAAAHVHRFLSIDQTILKQTADDMAEDANSVNNSFILLQEVAERLRGVVAKKFNEAVVDEDLASVERFFKIYPLLNMHEEGIKKYSMYLSTKLRDTSKKNLKMALDANRGDKKPNVIFADTMTLLLEGTARVLETHQPLVDTYYGPGRMVTLVSYLQQECDRQSKDIIAEMIKHRKLEIKIRQVNDYQNNVKAVEKLDPKSLDILLGELTMMHNKVDLYFKFVKRRVTSGFDSNAQNPEIEELLKNCELNRKMQELLGYYVLLERYFTEECVHKAMSIDSLLEESHISSMVDDVFYVVQKSIRRACSSGSMEGVCTVINNVCTLLETEYCPGLKQQLRQGYPSGYLDLTQAYNALQQGRLQASDPEQAKTLFLAYLNNADVSLEYVDKLKTMVSDEIKRSFPHMNEKDKEKVSICLSGLGSVTSTLTTAVIEYGMKQLKESAIKPRINPWISSFLDISHELTEDEFSSYEANEPFVQQLIANIDGLLSSFKETLTPTNYDTLVNVLTSEITKHLEKVVLKARFNRLGGLAFDKEIRALVTFLTSTTSWSIRDKFARLNQISTLLNLERLSEISEWMNSVSTVRLQPSEIKKVLSRRTDFNADEIEHLKL